MIDYIDIIPYILILSVLIVNISINTKKSNNFCFFILFVFSAIRFDVGYDYMSYLYILKLDASYDRFEFFEQLLQKLSAQYYIPLFFIVNSFITVYFVKWGVERISPNVSISLAAFLCIPLLYTHSFSIIRFWSAVAILFYASTFLKHRKWQVFIIFWLCSIGFHASAVIGILFLPLYYFRISKMLNIVLLLFSFIGGKFVLSQILDIAVQQSYMTDKLINYASIANTGNAMTKLPYVFLAFDILALLFWSKGKTKDDVFRNILITVFNFGVSVIFLFSFDTTLSSRLCRPFILYIIILIPIILKCISCKYKQIAKIIFEVLISALFIYTITIYNEGIHKSEYLPYKIIFFERY